MSILRNSVPEDYKILRNGLEGYTVLHNGTVELWTPAVPYSVDFIDYPLTVTNRGSNASEYYGATENGYSVSVKKTEDSVAYGQLICEVVLPTQKCNKVKVKYSVTHFSGSQTAGSINDINVVPCTDNELIFDCTGDDFILEIVAQDQTAYYTATINVTEVSFYYESV